MKVEVAMIDGICSAGLSSCDGTETSSRIVGEGLS